MSSHVSSHVVSAYLIGYCYSIVIGHGLICPLMHRLWSSVKDRFSVEFKAREELPHLPQMVGILERALYTTAWHLGKPEFIAIWLALKVAGQWQAWAAQHGRIVFNLYLIGSGFSVAYGVMGGVIIDGLAKWNVALGVVAPSALILATVCFYVWTSCCCKSYYAPLPIR